MKKTLFAVSVIFCFVNMTCSDDDSVPVDSDNLLIGSWISPVYDGDTITFEKTTELPKDAYGILFKTDGTFVERSFGWCATPPLVFFDSKGDWQLNNSIVSITQKQYPNNYTWRIVSLTASELVVKKELTDQEKDHRVLMDLFDEITKMAESVSCTKASDWAFTPYGSKACGGPRGYLAYSTSIDTNVFLEKIETYKNLEHAYNAKWDVVSTCEVPLEPKGLECQNGYPVLKY